MALPTVTLVPREGLEPSLLAEPDFESSVSAYSTTRACTSECVLSELRGSDVLILLYQQNRAAVKFTIIFLSCRCLL